MLKYKCPICEHTDKWENVDKYTAATNGLCMCASCGFCTYPEICIKDAELKKFYTESYRKIPTFGHLATGEAKLQYHKWFLRDVINKFEPKVIFEAGFGLGLLLKHLQERFKGAYVYGTELASTFSNTAKNLYGVGHKDDFDESLQHDLIISYQVAEHMPSIREEFKRYKKALSPGGIFYIGVPVWAGPLIQHMNKDFDLEYYYHPNHVNVWDQSAFEYLVNSSGFRIIKCKTDVYWATYACIHDDGTYSGSPGSAVYRREDMAKIQEAVNHKKSGRFKEAIEAYRDYPEAHLAWMYSELERCKNIPINTVISDFINPAINACGNSLWLTSKIFQLFVKNNCIQKAKEQLDILDEICGDAILVVSLHADWNEAAYKQTGDTLYRSAAIGNWQWIYDNFDGFKMTAVENLYRLGSEPSK